MAEPQYCNHCGRQLDFWDMQEDLTIHKDKLGYGTKHDGDSVHLQLCCDCFDKLVGECVINPVTGDEPDEFPDGFKPQETTPKKEVMNQNEC